jgi:3'-phosphoadenosine 5'-phosphosulfate sulfotransferase (PAPS reductase)/FAD synthetase
LLLNKTSAWWAQFLIDFDREDQSETSTRLVSEIMDSFDLDMHIKITRHILRLIVNEVEADGKELRGIVGLFSGGRDSTTFMHLFRKTLTHAGHANTGIGVEESREFVRRVCREWNLPLIEKKPRPEDSYEALVKQYGFPGPAGHAMMYRHLKERQFRQIRKELVDNGRAQRVIFVAGMRHFESARRMGNTQVTHREGSIVWCSPVAWWPTRLLKEYRERFDVPLNEVSVHLHMSGECLCGAFAKPGELDMVRMFYPETAAGIERLQVEVAAAEQPACIWGQRPPSQGMLKGCSNAEYAQSAIGEWEAENADKAFYLCSKCEILD